MQTHSCPMMPMRGGYYGRFPMRGSMMRRPWRQFPMGAERDFYCSPYEYGHHAWKGHGHRRKHKSHRRKDSKDRKRKSGDEKEDEIIIDGSSDESPDAEWENTVADVFEVNVYLRGCDPDNIKISTKDGVLKVEGKSKPSDTNFISVTHEQNIPEKVSVDNLKAFLNPEGLLTITEMEESVFPLQLKVDRK